ncbi:UNVERIFIED_CONTAM: hypothetical protein RF653_17470 [Kocuria sp. CPCC 205316]|uniref:hypothetical protein n=1 Tax=Kocuria TaxID=57493 RepID=UPI0036DE4B14
MATPQDYGFKDKDVIGLTDDDFHKLLEAEPEKYPEHLRIALSLDQWVCTLKGQLASGEVNGMEHKRFEGLLAALPEVAVALRQGQFLPGQQFRALTEAEIEDAERAADAELKAAFEEGFNG